jgi:hypothetical protein
MNDTTSKANLITLLQKTQNDYNITDNKIKEILNIENIDMDSMGNVGAKLIEVNYDLIEFAEMRNKKIEELLNAIKS